MIGLLLARRSTRKYLKQSVEREKVDKILTAGLLAPSSRGKKPWEFLVVDDVSVRYDLSKAKAHGSDFLKEAPVHIVVIADQNKSDVCIEDTSIAITCMQLEAERIGLGSCWVQIRLRSTKDGDSSEAYIRELLQIPDHYLVEAIIGIGYKGEQKEAYSKSDLLTDKIHFQQYGITYPYHKS